MAILAGDIKLVASRVMDDVPEGGGAPTANIIADGVSNAIFNDISELDRAGGRVSLRKVFASVQTTNVEGYFGANIIVADPPQDPRVAVTLFSTESTFDTRNTATSRIEAYLNAGPAWPGFLYENHIAGQRSLQIFARTTVEAPAVGRTVLLRHHEGLSDMVEQYVRITRVTSEERTFTYSVDRDYQAKIFTCDLSDALRYDFPGSPSSRSFEIVPGKTLIRDTVVADAAVYYGVVALAEPAAIGDVKVKGASVYSALVPNSQTETALTDQYPSRFAQLVIASAPRKVEVSSSPFSQRIKIGQENRGFNYTTIVAPLPAPGSVRVTYRALGQNYSITDNADGTMSGSGTGTVNYLTGSITVTLAALPDDRSAVMFYWGQSESFTNRAGAIGFRVPEYAFSLEKRNVEPSSLTISWTSAGTSKSASIDAKGKFTGDASGEVVLGTGMLFLRPHAMPDALTAFAISYQWSDVTEEAHPSLTPDASGFVNIPLASEPVPGTVSVQWATTRTNTSSSGVTSAGGSSTKQSGAFQQASASSSGSSSSTVGTAIAMVDRTQILAVGTAEWDRAYTSPPSEAVIETTGSPKFGYVPAGAVATY